jgi:hypothetical protein
LIYLLENGSFASLQPWSYPAWNGVPFAIAPCLTRIETVSLSDKPVEFVTVNINVIVVSACKFEGAVKLAVA